MKWVFTSALLLALALSWWAYGFLAAVLAACAALIGLWWAAAILTGQA